MDWDQFASAKLINEVKAELEEQPDDYEQIVARVTAMKERTMLEEHDWATGTMIILSPVPGSLERSSVSKGQYKLKEY